MSFIKDFFSGGIEGVGKAVRGVLDELRVDDEEKAAAALKLEALFQADRMAREETHRKEIEAQQAVLVAELQQGDTFTKRARPSIVYAGLAMMAWNFCIVPSIAFFAALNGYAGPEVTPVDLPVGFWASWGGVTATWSIGRTRERMGKQDRVTKAILG